MCDNPFSVHDLDLTRHDIRWHPQHLGQAKAVTWSLVAAYADGFGFNYAYLVRFLQHRNETSGWGGDPKYFHPVPIPSPDEFLAILEFRSDQLTRAIKDPAAEWCWPKAWGHVTWNGPIVAGARGPGSYRLWDVNHEDLAKLKLVETQNGIMVHRLLSLGFLGGEKMAVQHRAFLAMPFRPELRWVREAIRKATTELGIQLRAVDETLAPGEEIISGIRQEIRKSTLAYVVLTDLNPNVMYELGLLHEASKPTILLTQKDSISNLPFDIRTRMVVTFEGRADAAEDLRMAVVTATGRLLALFDPSVRQQLITADAGPPSLSFHQVQLSISQFDWEKIKNDGARAVGRKGCSTNNISPHDDGQFKGWRLKARCAGGDTIHVYVDMNGDIASVDVQ